MIRLLKSRKLKELRQFFRDNGLTSSDICTILITYSFSDLRIMYNEMKYAKRLMY